MMTKHNANHQMTLKMQLRTERRVKWRLIQARMTQALVVLQPTMTTTSTNRQVAQQKINKVVPNRLIRLIRRENQSHNKRRNLKLIEL